MDQPRSWNQVNGRDHEQERVVAQLKQAAPRGS